MNKILFFISLHLAFGCKELEMSMPANAEKSAVDSFQIQGIQSLSEFLNFKKINDSTFRSLDMQSHEVNYYVNNKNAVFNWKSRIKILPKGYLPCFFCDRDNACYSINEGGTIFKYNENFLISDTINLTGLLPFLKNNYCFFSYNSKPLIILGDTIIGSPSYKELDGYYTWFKEPSMMEFILKGDSMTNAHSFFTKPSGLKKIRYPWPAYCYGNNTVALIYPGYDTLYTYNRITRNEKKIPLNNKDFKVSNNYDPKNIGDMGYNTKYELASFRYEAVYFNELTEHYIIISKLPAENKDKTKAVPFENQHGGALILDKQFATVLNVKFEKRYFEPANFFFYPGKGLAMPVFKNKNTYDTTKFYIYNF
ncbi:MAG: hypothetical protein ACJ76F_01605 [Bacteroidia bacterium]